ncbi:MAG TPA: signal peptidase I [Candidatus Acidoferrum sp.]|nr:signal peptidase I [Candidatus Acidoferrum sp.]
MNHAETGKSQNARSTHKKTLCEADSSFGARFRDHGSVLRESQRNSAFLRSQPESFLDRGFSGRDQSTEAFSALGSDLVEEIVRNSGWACVRVRGTSMTPAVQPGDLLTIQHTNFQEISIGQIVLYARGGRLITHRVVEKSGGPQAPHLITRGDRVAQNDSPVSPDELLGRVKFIERGGRRFQPADHPDVQRQWLCRVLRASDRATSIYLRVAEFWRALAGEGVW